MRTTGVIAAPTASLTSLRSNSSSATCPLVRYGRTFRARGEPSAPNQTIAASGSTYAEIREAIAAPIQPSSQMVLPSTRSGMP